jgi:hypothetical protein
MDCKQTKKNIGVYIQILKVELTVIELMKPEMDYNECEIQMYTEIKITTFSFILSKIPKTTI